MVVTKKNYWKEKRANTSLSQGHVAKALGYKTSQIVSNWERNVCSPPVKDIRKLIDLYNINIDEYVKTIMSEQLENVKKHLAVDINCHIIFDEPKNQLQNQIDTI